MSYFAKANSTDQHVTFVKTGKIARITLNRPHRGNAISLQMPIQLSNAIEKANLDDDIHVILLQGAGKGFCSGYDLKIFAEVKGEQPGSQSMPWDPLIDYQGMNFATQCFLSIWRSLKPVVCKVHGFAIAGGSDIALCCDVILISENAKIGYPPARVWGCPTTAMWAYRIGLERAKRLMLTGDVIDGKTAMKWGLVSSCHKEEELDDKVEEILQRMSTIPKNQLMMQKMVINSVYENMGMQVIQKLATIMDGIARHTKEGIAFKKRCEQVGFKQAVLERDLGVKSKL